MSRTTILPSDPLKRRAWAATVAEDSIKEQYFARMMGPEGSRSAVIKKTDLEKGAGDEVVTALVAKLRGTPIIERQKLAGAEFRLQNASHTMRINEFRHGVNIGARIEQSRVGYNLKKQGRDRLKDYIKELYEEVIALAAAGERGDNTSEFQHLTPTWTAYPNALRAPDAAHLFIGRNGTSTASTLGATADTLTLASINALRVKAKKFLGGQPDSGVKITPVVKGGKEVYILAVLPEVMQDIRNDSGAQGWFEAQKALTTAIGKESEIFKGGAGMFNGVLVDEMDVGVKFSAINTTGKYTSNGTTGVAAARSLFLGSGAIAVAHGTKGMADGLEVELDEDMDDRKHDAILFFEMIFGADKCVYNSLDYAQITVDSTFTASV
jgi:N4-gp56 family major capsid protein